MPMGHREKHDGETRSNTRVRLDMARGQGVRGSGDWNLKGRVNHSDQLLDFFNRILDMSDCVGRVWSGEELAALNPFKEEFPLSRRREKAVLNCRMGLSFLGVSEVTFELLSNLPLDAAFVIADIFKGKDLAATQPGQVCAKAE